MTETDKEGIPPEPSGEGVYNAPWEKPFENIITPFEEFIHRQTTTGLILIGTTIIALVLANSAWADLYQQVKDAYAGISVGNWELKLSMLHWVNDGLMAFFFFVVGLELKREITVGELAKPGQAILPVACAVGGMLVPAFIYSAINYNGGGMRGWGVPMATDIAFAIGILVLLADRIPKSLITFLVALAIVDDLGAVLVIALFYTDSLDIGWMIITVAIIGILVSFNLGGVRAIVPYFITAIFLWFALHESGIHASLAGVIGAFTVPAKPKYDPAVFSRHVSDLMSRFDTSFARNNNILLNDNLRAQVTSLEEGVHSVQAPLQRLIHIWHLPVSFLVIPVFALMNAGIAINVDILKDSLTHQVTLGIMAGLILGKFIGISGTAWLLLKLGFSELPRGTSFSQIAGVSLIAGIGFTMAIFIAELGFVNSDNLYMAKMGIIMASLVAGVGGFIWLYLCSPKDRA